MIKYNKLMVRKYKGKTQINQITQMTARKVK